MNLIFVATALGLQPSDLNYFRLIVHFFSGHNFDNVTELEQEFDDFFASKTKE